jgi:hypothetical protein
MNRAEALQAARQSVDAGHAAVRTARYQEALVAFGEALPVLRTELGEGHVEVRTLAEDIETVRSMAGMWARGQARGLGGVGAREGAVTWRPDGSSGEK